MWPPGAFLVASACWGFLGGGGGGAAEPQIPEEQAASVSSPLSQGHQGSGFWLQLWGGGLCRLATRQQAPSYGFRLLPQPWAHHPIPPGPCCLPGPSLPPYPPPHTRFNLFSGLPGLKRVDTGIETAVYRIQQINYVVIHKENV
ncbi:hypothetical protein UY3_11729 [Chelonia mydas]|uniref:Uncharacterized protein n=1 Tax=Chelonia mydas TaxID=8469 RepID=M7B6H9_CHEMY|nr:hypothetical protein UY3_11729 [Chelonia mydas]